MRQCKAKTEKTIMDVLVEIHDMLVVLVGGDYFTEGGVVDKAKKRLVKDGILSKAEE